MTELEIWSSSLKTLTITGNSDLTKITGDKIVALGATASTAAAPQTTVTIHSNDLEASVAQVLTAATAANAGDSTGNFTTASNMGSLSPYLKLVAADVYSTAGVYYDTVQSTTSSVSVETGSTTTYASNPAENAILITAPGSGGVTTGNNAAVKGQRAWQIPNVAGTGVNLVVDTVEVLHNGTTYGTVTTVGNLAIDLVALKTALATSRATTLGTTLNVRAEGHPLMPSVTFLSNVTSATGGNGENYTNTQVATLGAGLTSSFLTSWDVFTITIDGLSATASITNASATGVAAATQIADNLSIAWDLKYGTSHGVSKTLSLWDVASATTYGIEVALKATSSGSRGFGKEVSIAWAQATAAQISIATAGVVTQTSALVADWTIGATEASTDNTAVGSALVMTLLEVTNGIGVAATSGSDKATATFQKVNDAAELATTQLTAGAGTDTTTTADIFEDDARGDVVLAEGANEGTTSATVARTLTNRSQWTFTAG
jgi:hypothetical protein